MANVNLENLGDRLADFIDERLGGIKAPLDDALPGAGDIFIKYAKAETDKKGVFNPKNADGEHFKDSWEVQRKSKYKHTVFVGNSKKVSSKASDSIPLINIIEYGTHDKKDLKPRPIIDDALNAAADEIMDYIASAIENNL